MDFTHVLEPHLPKDKVVLVGNPGVGKSTIYQRFKTGKFVQPEDLAQHMHAKEFYKEWTVEDTQVSVSHLLIHRMTNRRLSCLPACLLEYLPTYLCLSVCCLSV